MYGIQPLCFNNYGDPYKGRFNHFKEELAAMRKKDLGRVLALAKQYDVRIGSSKRVIR